MLPRTTVQKVSSSARAKAPPRKQVANASPTDRQKKSMDHPAFNTRDPCFGRWRAAWRSQKSPASSRSWRTTSVQATGKDGEGQRSGVMTDREPVKRSSLFASNAKGGHQASQGVFKTGLRSLLLLQGRGPQVQ